ncbi:hypothetical protein HK102_000205 [Quaeritorhiza haematococci]|nr:hypothetical protein HK102_000205 [Quaeritorhiza haematococci]
MVAGSVAYGCIATGSQFAYTFGRHWRQNVGLRYHEERQQQALSAATNAEEKPWWKHPFREKARSLHDLDDGPNPDPFKDVVLWIRDKIADTVGGLPDWASPLANALDLEYRQKLNVRLRILERQVTELRISVDALKKEEQQLSGGTAIQS